MWPVIYEAAGMQRNATSSGSPNRPRGVRATCFAVTSSSNSYKKWIWSPRKTGLISLLIFEREREREILLAVWVAFWCIKAQQNSFEYWSFAHPQAKFLVSWFNAAKQNNKQNLDTHTAFLQPFIHVKQGVYFCNLSVIWIISRRRASVRHIPLLAE